MLINQKISEGSGSSSDYTNFSGQWGNTQGNSGYAPPNKYNYSGNSEASNSIPQSSCQLKCAYCNGTGRIEKNDNAPASFGQSKANKKCSECGKIYDPTVFNHYHVQCGHCGGTGYNK